MSFNLVLHRARSGPIIVTATAFMLAVSLSAAAAQPSSSTKPASEATPNPAAPKAWMESPELPKDDAATVGTSPPTTAGKSMEDHGRPQAPEQPYPSKTPNSE